MDSPRGLTATTRVSDDQANPDKRVLRQVEEHGEPLPIRQNPMAQVLAGRVLASSSVEGRVELEFRPAHTFVQGAGVVQGGIVAAMLDFPDGVRRPGGRAVWTVPGHGVPERFVPASYTDWELPSAWPRGARGPFSAVRGRPPCRARWPRRRRGELDPCFGTGRTTVTLLAQE